MALSATKTVREVAADVKHRPAAAAAAIKAKVVERIELPPWMQGDAYIERGYRTQQNSFRGCFHSLWYIHNETVNVWSHLSIGIFFLAMALWASFPALHRGYAFNRADLIAVQTYLVGATICCLFSVSALSPTTYLHLAQPWFRRIPALS